MLFTHRGELPILLKPLWALGALPSGAFTLNYINSMNIHLLWG